MKTHAWPVKRLLVLAPGVLLLLLGWLATPRPVEAQASCTTGEWEGQWMPLSQRCAAPTHVDCSGVIILCRPQY